MRDLLPFSVHSHGRTNGGKWHSPVEIE